MKWIPDSTLPQNSNAANKITQDAIAKADRIMRQIDLRHATLNNRDCAAVAWVPENFDPFRRAYLFPVRPGVALFFAFFSSEGLDAKALRALVADGDLRRLTAQIANVVCVFGPGAGSRGDYVHALCLLSNLVRRLTDASH
jgi:hypothetical protein